MSWLWQTRQLPALSAATRQSQGARPVVAAPVAPSATPSGYFAPVAPITAKPPDGETLRRAHVDIATAVRVFSERVAVDAPKKPADAPPATGAARAPSVVADGQFYWSGRLEDGIRARLATLTQPWVEAGLGTEQAALLDAWDSYVSALHEREAAPLLLAKRALGGLVKDAAKDPARRGAVAGLRGVVSGGGDLTYMGAWTSVLLHGKMPDLSRTLSIPALEAMFEAETTLCATTAGLTADRFVARGGFSEASMKRPGTAFEGAALFEGARRDLSKDGARRMLGDLLRFKPLAATIDRLKAGLDAGFVYHARVLSGLGSGDVEADTSTEPKAVPARDEHSIVIIGYDGDEFVFWDPDSGVSARHGQGFGSLFYDSLNNRLTTARDASDLRVNFSGNHRRGDHRYQVMSLQRK